MTRVARPLPAALASLGLMLALGGCSTSQAPDPYQDFTGQTLTWGACDPTLVPYPVVQKAVGSRLQCADIKIPLDWNSPARGTMSFSMLRVKAADTANRKGAIFFNPGGPGGDGLLFGAIYGYLWNQADTSTPAGAALKALSDGYDLVGFSPRGVGQSSRLVCGSNETFSPEQYQSEDRSETNIQAMLRNARLVAQACLKNPITPYINTDQTARDLNLARGLMGDAKLNYVGYSYGTWLGSWFAGRFPEQTGRMLLDGNTAFDKTFQDVFGLQPLGFDRSFREVALAYAARHNDLFGLGATAGEVYGVYNAFPGALKYTLQVYSPSNVITNLYSSYTIPDISVQLVAARGFAATLAAHPEATTPAALAERLAAQKYAQNADLDEAARQEALAMADVYLFIVNRVPPGTVELGNSGSVFTAVVNNDTPWTQDPQYWIDLGNREAREHPLIGGGITETSGMFWTAPTTTKPGLPANLPPLLLVHTEDDPATPREGAFSAFRSLPQNARMLFVDNEAQHTAFPYGTDCVDLNVAQYFLSGALPQDRFTACQALPLPGEDRVYPFGETYTTGPVSPQNLHRQALGGTAETKPALKLLRDIIRRNALPPRPR